MGPDAAGKIPPCTPWQALFTRAPCDNKRKPRAHSGLCAFYDDDGQAHVIASADGVDQGGPLSPPAFAFGLRRALRRIRARLHAMLDAAREAGDETLAGSVVRLLSYLDDLTILVPSPLMGTAMAIADEELQAVGLYLNHCKTFVWAKSGRCSRGCQRWWKDTDGFVIVGATYGRLVGPVDAGTEAEEGADVVDHDIVEAPVASKCAHLWRLLPPPYTADFCRDVDERVARAFCTVNDVEEHFGPVQRRLYGAPASWGGLGMRPLYAVRNAAFVGAWMHCMAHVRTHHGAAMPGFDDGWDPGGVARYSFHGEYRCALAALDAELGPDDTTYEVLGFSLRDALRTEQARCQKALSRAVLAREHARWKATLDPSSRALVVLGMASGEGRRPLASEWLLTAPFNARTALPDTEYQVAIRLRLDMPLCDRGDPCRVQKGVRPRAREAVPTLGRECAASLLPHADHAQACATWARDVRHDGVADMCAAIYREAGLPAHRETEVPGVLSSTQKQPIRADVIARARAPATWQCAEVKIR
eukprot:gene19242-biopygen33614